MSEKETPIEIEGIQESLYGGFWVRLGALLLDTVFLLPYGFLVLYLNGLSKNAYFYTFVPSQIFILWYYVYLVKVNGGTPGKLIVGIKIIKLNGDDVRWKEAILRYIIQFILGLLSAIWMGYCLLQEDDNTFRSLNWLSQTQYLITLAPVFFKFYTWVSNIWIYSEFIVLLTNKRKRAVHDFIAGTVIVKTKYIDDIRAVINGTYVNLDNQQNSEVTPSVEYHLSGRDKLSNIKIFDV